MADLGNLVVKIEADVKGLKDSLAQGQSHVKNFSDSTTKSLDFIANAFKFVFAEKVVSYLEESFKKTVEYGAQLEHLAIISNVTAGEVAKLQYAFKQEGGSVDDLNRILPILARNISEGAKSGSAMSDNFRKLGIDVRDSQGNLKNVSLVFTELADKIGGMKDKTEALAITMQVLGRGGKEAFELFSKGGDNLKRLTQEFDSFGVSGEVLVKFAKDSKELEDAWSKVQTRFELMKVVLVEKLMPALLKITEQLGNYDWNALATGIAEATTAFLKLYDAFAKFTGDMVYNIFKPIFDLKIALENIIATINSSPALKALFGQAGGAGMVGAGANAGAVSQQGMGALSSIGSSLTSAPGISAGVPGGVMAVGASMAQTGGGAPGAGQVGSTPGSAPGSESTEGGDGKASGILGILKAIKELPTALKNSTKMMEKPLKDLDGIFVNLGKGIEKTFQSAFTAMMQGGQSFSEALMGGFKSVAIEFISMIATMILKWTAFFLAVMAIALILSAFGVPIGTTFKAAFAFVQGGGSADAKDATGGIKASAGNMFKGFLGLRSGGALMARNGLMTAQTGMAVTGGLGEGGIPVMAHPNEIIAPIDKVFEFMAKGTFGGGMTVNVSGYNQDPRELAETIMIEIERKRRNP